MSAHLSPPTLIGNHLKPHTAYGASVESEKYDGVWLNVGIGDQLTDAEGHVVFRLDPMIWSAVATAGRPCTVRCWIREGGTGEDAPPAAGTKLVTFSVV
jgi:hypothetical protein